VWKLPYLTLWPTTLVGPMASCSHSAVRRALFSDIEESSCWAWWHVPVVPATTWEEDCFSPAAWCQLGWQNETDSFIFCLLVYSNCTKGFHFHTCIQNLLWSNSPPLLLFLIPPFLVVLEFELRVPRFTIWAMSPNTFYFHYFGNRSSHLCLDFPMILLFKLG
jgi:hypothetical protein